MPENTPERFLSVQDVGIDYALRRRLGHNTRFTALENISFELCAGDSLGILGRNGAGKSSLLKALAGIIAPDRGRIINHGAKVALMALQTGFDPQLSGRHNILLSGLLLGFSKKEVLRQTESIVAFSELGEFIDRPVNTYSMGMRARLGFSICHALKPDVLLIDEVLGVGDLDFRKKSSSAMRERIKSGQTVVLVSHEPAAIRQLCNRAVWIEHGVVQRNGSTEDVVKAYEAHMLKLSN